VTINPATTFGEDMAFDGTSLWRVHIRAQRVDKIDPSNGNITFSFDPGFQPLGLAWDGSNLWVSQFTVDGLVKQFTPTGVATGNQFNANLGLGNEVGGLAFDTADGTLWIGTFSTVYNYTTAGVQLGSFAVPVPDGRFVDGLEFQGTSIPEPASFFLLGSGLALLGGVFRKHSRNR
jgi:sugar lactone lactonase YvrE